MQLSLLIFLLPVIIVVWWLWLVLGAVQRFSPCIVFDPKSVITDQKTTYTDFQYAALLRPKGQKRSLTLFTATSLMLRGPLQTVDYW